MTVLVLDGPEAAGKSTLIEAIKDFYPRSSTTRRWGPVSDWSAYVSPLAEDLFHRDLLHIWDRSWAAEVVYDLLLGRGRNPSELEIRRTLEQPVNRHGGLMVMVMSPVEVLRARREERRRAGGKADLPCDPASEHAAFLGYARRNAWIIVDGTKDARENAGIILKALSPGGYRAA